MIPTCWHVGRHKIDAGLFEPEQEVRVAAEAINLCDDKLCPLYRHAFRASARTGCARAQ
jgi:hypothetical protein